MPAVEHLSTLGRTRLSFADEADIDEFVTTLERYERGELTPDQWRAFRLVRGTYGQRQSDASMLRVKIPQGILDGPQLHALADVADQYSRGFGHITTRQNIQLHFMQLHDVEKAMRRLAEVGLTTREACGNSVRNITACPYAGVSPDEAFDVTPYAEALTRFLLRHPLSSTLPRKFKIAFEGCAEDHALSLINDLAFRALPDDGAGRAFRVNAGGGTAILCTSAGLLFERLPAGEIFTVAEAVLRVFHRLGDYKHKAAQPDEVPDPGHGLGRLAGRVRPGLRRRARRRRPAASLRPRGPARRSRRPLDPGPALPGRRTRRRACWRVPCAGPAFVPRCVRS